MIIKMGKTYIDMGFCFFLFFEQLESQVKLN
jgi:hypothetical protein